MNRISNDLLKVIFTLDGLIAVVFGLYSWFFPYQTFGTIIAIPETHASVFLGILSGLSLFYIFDWIDLLNWT